MKIGSSLDTSVTTGPALRGPARATGSEPAAGAVAADQVAVSAAGAQMGMPGGAGDFDSAKVDAIRQAMRDGRFTVNPEAIADRLIADAAALLRPRSA